MTTGAGPQARVDALERQLLVTLAAWATWSMGVGGVLRRLGRREGVPALASVGGTTLAWGAVDAGVVAWGAWRGRSSRAADPVARARRLALVTGANAVLDVGYVTGGALLATSSRRRGVGLATVVQGLALLYLDTRYCLEFGAVARDAERGSALGPLHSARARDRRRPASRRGDGPGGNDSVVVRNGS